MEPKQFTQSLFTQYKKCLFINVFIYYVMSVNTLRIIITKIKCVYDQIDEDEVLELNHFKIPIIEAMIKMVFNHIKDTNTYNRVRQTKVMLLLNGMVN